MNKKSFFKGVGSILAELFEEGSYYIALFGGILVWAISKSIWIGIISGAVIAFIFNFLIDGTIRSKKDPEHINSNIQPKRQYKPWSLLLILVALIAAGSLTAYLAVS